jgi:hypothetical protein
MRAIAQCIELHRRRPVRFLREPAGMMVAGLSWSIMIVSLCALWLSLSYWLGIWSLWGMIEGAVLTASVGMCMWTHYMVMTTEPGFVPMRNKTNKLGGNASSGAIGDEDESVASQSDDDEEADEMPLEEFENLEDDGSLLVFCDECNMYRPTRYVARRLCGALLGGHSSTLYP